MSSGSRSLSRARATLGKLAAVDGRRRALVACGLGWVVLSRATLAAPGGSLPRRQRWLDRLAARLPSPPPCDLDEAAWAITAAAGRVPGTRCLAWSLALRGLLTQAGIASELRIGLASAAPGGIKAHAWVESAGRAWSWGEVEGYSVLAASAANAAAPSGVAPRGSAPA
jgi:hypothetical protein